MRLHAAGSAEVEMMIYIDRHVYARITWPPVVIVIGHAYRMKFTV